LHIGYIATFSGVPENLLAVGLAFQPEPIWFDNLVLQGSLHVLRSLDGEMGHEREFVSDFQRCSELAIAPYQHDLYTDWNYGRGLRYHW
jgi:hypothetical protein